MERRHRDASRSAATRCSRASNPLRGLTADSEYVKSILATIEGPIVLVGHSYGGAVITNAATGNPNVKSLVYVAAYALDAGETTGRRQRARRRPLGPRRPPRDPPVPGRARGRRRRLHRPGVLPRAVRGRPPEEAGRRPGGVAASRCPRRRCSPRRATPAWKTIPSWYLVAAQDHTIPPEAERAMAERAGATTIEIDSSHVAMMSHPDVVAQLILDAAR